MIEIKFASEVLGMQTSINVIVPQRSTKGEIGIDNAAKDEKYKTLLLLHGLSDDNSIWLRRTSIERYATELGIAVVMPSAERSFYTDMKYGDRYYTYISQEVLRVAREFLPLSNKREDTFIMGNSMGGYGAMKIAMKNPDAFVSAAGLSSVADIEDSMDRHPDLRRVIFGEGEIPCDENLFDIAQATSENQIKPRILMIEGTRDFMYDTNIKLKEKFESLDYEYHYMEAPGGHTWGFWDKYTLYALKWLLQIEE